MLVVSWKKIEVYEGIPPKKKDKTIGTSWDNSRGQCKGTFARVDYFINGLRSNMQCPPPTPVNEMLPKQGNGYVQNGKCYASYCSMKRTPSKILSCNRSTGSTNQYANYPGKIDVSGTTASCRVSNGIMTSTMAAYSDISCPSGYFAAAPSDRMRGMDNCFLDESIPHAANTNRNTFPISCRKPDSMNGLFCSPPPSYPVYEGAALCSPGNDWGYKTDAVNVIDKCVAKYGTAKDGYYKPYTGTAQDAAAVLQGN